jgi:dolichol kinase
VLAAGVISSPACHGTAHVQRHGVASELLSGPCFYGLAHAWLCASYWRESPAGLVGIAALCAGDGMAEVIGRRCGHWS